MTERVRTYVERYVTGTWADISSFVVGDIEIEYLISKPDDDAKLASVGRMNFVADNRTGNFSPNSNFQRGTKIRVRCVYDGVSKTRFQGTIRRLDPDTLEWGDQYVRADCVDWMQYAVDYPSVVLALQQNYTIDQAAAYLLSIMSVQPESVTYYAGRETFNFVFDNTRNATQVYTELNRLALSEFSNIYLRAGNVLVVESADTRSGTRELTQVPQAPSQQHAILTDPNGGLIITIDVPNSNVKYALLADEAVTPNLATGTIQPMDIEIQNGDNLTNRVVAKTYPTREDATPVLLFKLDVNWTIPTNSAITLKGNYADPNGGAPISAKDFSPLVTGTSYIFTNKDGSVDQTTQLQITTNYGSQSFEHQVYNAGNGGVIRKFEIYGIGIYPYNPVSSPVSVTGSMTSYSISEMTLDQRYQDDTNAGMRIAETISDDEKDPRNRLMGATFDASGSPELMQASQYMDTGDLTWIKNVKPAIDTYAYIRGKKVVISTAGVITETWYLKEMDSLRKGLRMVALNFPGKTGSKQAVDFGVHGKHNTSGEMTWMCWLRESVIGTTPLMSKVSVLVSGNTSNDLFTFGGTQNLIAFRRSWSTSAGVWTTATGSITNWQNTWHHVAVAYDDSSADNDPTIYFDGVAQAIDKASAPAGTLLDWSDANLKIGNVDTSVGDNLYNPNYQIKDVRIYNRILSPSEVATIASNNRDYLSVTNGLVFQAPCVKEEDYSGITGTVLYSTNKLIDNMYGVRGTPQALFVSGTAWMFKAFDPNS